MCNITTKLGSLTTKLCQSYKQTLIKFIPTENPNVHMSLCYVSMATPRSILFLEELSHLPPVHVIVCSQFLRPLPPVFPASSRIGGRRWDDSQNTGACEHQPDQSVGTLPGLWPPQERLHQCCQVQRRRRGEGERWMYRSSVQKTISKPHLRQW